MPPDENASGTPPPETGGTPPPEGGAPEGGTPAIPGPEGTPATPVATVFGDDWREQMAGGDDKLLGQLKRANTPGDFATSYLELRAKMDKGVEPLKLTEDATPEQVAEYRKANGIPDEPTGYDLKLDDGIEISDADQPLLDGIKAAAHAANAPPGAVNAMVNAYYQMEKQQTEALLESDSQKQSEMVAALRQEWGADYTANQNAVTQYMGRLPDAIREAFMGGRLADGTPLLASADFVKHAASIQRALDPAATLTNQTTSPNQTLREEIANFRAMLKDPARKAAEYTNNSEARERFNQLLAWENDNKPGR